MNRVTENTPRTKAARHKGRWGLKVPSVKGSGLLSSSNDILMKEAVASLGTVRNHSWKRRISFYRITLLCEVNRSSQSEHGQSSKSGKKDTFCRCLSSWVILPKTPKCFIKCIKFSFISFSSDVLSWLMFIPGRRNWHVLCMPTREEETQLFFWLAYPRLNGRRHRENLYITKSAHWNLSAHANLLSCLLSQIRWWTCKPCQDVAEARGSHLIFFGGGLRKGNDKKSPLK